MKKWKNQIGEKALLSNGKPLPVILLVNKCDITENQLSEEAINAVCKECGIATWFRVRLSRNYDCRLLQRQREYQ